jgi:hypothetical protein
MSAKKGDPQAKRKSLSQATGERGGGVGWGEIHETSSILDVQTCRTNPSGLNLAKSWNSTELRNRYREQGNKRTAAAAMASMLPKNGYDI